MSWQGLDFDFTGVVFDGGTFYGAEFSGGMISFGRATFSGGTVSFGGATFSGGTVYFEEATFSGGAVTFGEATFSGGTVYFGDAWFSGGRVGFGGATFSSGRVTFYGAAFSGGTVDFRQAWFSGGAVVFLDPRDWSYPPAFDWRGEPPKGVMMPQLRAGTAAPAAGPPRGANLPAGARAAGWPGVNLVLTRERPGRTSTRGYSGGGGTLSARPGAARAVTRAGAAGRPQPPARARTPGDRRHNAQLPPRAGTIDDPAPRSGDAWVSRRRITRLRRLYNLAAKPPAPRRPFTDHSRS